MLVDEPPAGSSASDTFGEISPPNLLSRPRMYDQFLIARAEHAHPADFETSSLLGWNISVSPNLPLTRITAHGSVVGWILGWLILEDGRFSYEDGALDMPEPGREEFEDALYGRAGRWACFVEINGSLQVYVDPSASLGVVYRGEDESIASTTSILNWGDSDSFTPERYSRRVLGKNQFFPSGLTSDARIRRVLPNHRLDTSNWRTTRHWPTKALTRFTSGAEVESATERIAASTKAVMDALLEHGTIIVPMTSGRDSRIIMSSLRGQLDRCEFFTFRYHDFRKADGPYAEVVSRKYSLNHRLVTIPTPSDDDRRIYLEAVGYDANEGKARDFYLAAASLPSDRGWVTGYVGEVGRGYFWRPEDGATIPATDDLLARLRLNHTAENAGAVESWVRDAVYADTRQMLDLLYLEQRQGAWASTQLYGAAPFRFSIIPMNTRHTIQDMLRLPVDYVLGGQMPRDIARHGWPELAALPYDRRPGMRGRIDYALFRVRRDGGRLYRRLTNTKSR
ncbi:hypothetical protein [Herbiconiux sp. YIM B11900]|uniref:hypothetical protein n=1 Tax=Herbiconiux sp. YIM B11900 TaxID=3404131 RepID=UPI003F867640